MRIYQSPRVDDIFKDYDEKMSRIHKLRIMTDGSYREEEDEIRKETAEKIDDIKKYFTKPNETNKKPSTRTARRKESKHKTPRKRS